MEFYLMWCFLLGTFLVGTHLTSMFLLGTYLTLGLSSLLVFPLVSSTGSLSLQVSGDGSCAGWRGDTVEVRVASRVTVVQ